MRPRYRNTAKLLAEVRAHDFASHSDAGLREAVRGLRAAEHEADGDGMLASCLAIVAETIDRRLGVWRLFDDARLPLPVAEDAAVIAEARGAVAEQRRFRRPGAILLPADFYRAARESDTEGCLRFRPTDEQVLAGIHLWRGRVVQMDAGEGKTVAIALAAAAHAVVGPAGPRRHRQRIPGRADAALLEPVYSTLGLSSGALLGHMEAGERRHVYGRSIVYGAMRELGFDYLRDNLRSSPDEWVHQPLDVAIVDEADHALIDEAYTPMIISGNPLGGTRSAVRVNSAVADMIARQRALARQLAGDLEARGTGGRESLLPLGTLMLADPGSPVLRQCLSDQPGLLRRVRALAEDEHDDLAADLHYAVQPDKRYVSLTDRGREYLEQRLGPVFGPAAVDDDQSTGPADAPPGSQRHFSVPGRSSGRRYRLANQVLQALRAHLLLERDVDYVVDGDGVVLIDPHTGRPKPDSIYQQGLQSAVEAREGVYVRPESETLAQISVSGLVSRYRGVAGITGTAARPPGSCGANTVWR